MAILKGLIRKLNGSAGDFTFKQMNGQTIVSEKVTNVKNTRTSAQQRHRMKWANMVQMFKGISPLLLQGFENKASGVSDYNMFMKVNINVSPVYLSKSDVAGGACIAAPYQITQGTLPSIVVSGTGAARKTDIALGELTLDADTTVADFSNAVVLNNADYSYGDQISFFICQQKINAVTGIPYCQFLASAIELDKSSKAKLWTMVNQAGFASVDGVLAAEVSSYGDCAYAWVHSRKASAKTSVSTQFLEDNNALLPSYTSDEAYERASESYGEVKDVFLTPESEDQNQVTLTLSASPADAGSVSGAGTYDAGETVEIKAEAASGYTFQRWSDGNTSATRQLTLTKSQSLIAVFSAS